MKKLFTLSLSFFIFSYTFTQEKTPFEKLANLRLRCFTEVSKPTLTLEEQVALKKKLDLDIPELEEHAVHSQIFSLLNNTNHAPSTVMSDNVWKDLEIIIGDVNVHAHLHGCINRTTTLFGNDYLNYRLTHPDSSIEKLQLRQAAVEMVATHKDLFKKLISALELAQKGENTFLFMYKNPTEQTRKMLASFYHNSNLPLLRNLKQLNSNAVYLQTTTLLGRIPSLILAGWYPTLEFWGHNTITGYQKLEKNESGYPTQAEIKRAYPHAKETIDRIKSSQKLMMEKDIVRWRLGPNSPEYKALANKEHYCTPFEKNEYFGFAFQVGGDILWSLKDALRFGLKHHKPDGYSITTQRLLRRHNPFVVKLKNPEGTYLPDLETNDFPSWGDDWQNAKTFDQETQKNWPNAPFAFRHQAKIGLTIRDTTMLGLVAGTAYLAKQREKHYNNLTNYMHEQLIATSKIVRAMKKCSILIKKHSALADGLEHAKDLHALFDRSSSKASEKLNRLAELLLTNTFTGEPTYFCLKGRVLAAYSLMQSMKQDLAPALRALAEIDVVVSTAQLYNEFKGENIEYSFPVYLDKQHPEISLVDMWNPFIPVKKVVKNSIELGGDNPQNIILTGPNAGGKSTFLKGTSISILLAQTLAITPAKQLVFTPFAKINTYMNITDDTAGGNSLFKSEVLRAQGLVESIKSLDPRDFSFSIMDEMFSGTSPKEGAAASYAVAKNLSERHNSILLLASHFPLLTELETDTNNFTNYQVRVIRHENGSFSYPFKLETGIADQNVAMDILQQQGFDSSILNDANAVLNR